MLWWHLANVTCKVREETLRKRGFSGEPRNAGGVLGRHSTRGKQSLVAGQGCWQLFGGRLEIST